MPLYPPATTAGADLATHIADSSDAHDASAISIADAGTYFTGTDVEAALQELGAGGTSGGNVTTVEPQAHQSRLYLMRDGTWRDPLISGLGTVTAGSGATITNDTKYNAWPSVARLTEDRLIVAYTKADSHHGDQTGKAVVKIGTEDGDGTVTWGTEITAYDHVSLWVSAMGVSRISTGRVFLGVWRDDQTTPGTGEAGVVYSDDDGATWSAWVDLTNGFAQEAFTAGPVCEMPDGDLLATIEGTASGAVLNRSSHTVRSTDGGLTWGGEVTIRNYVTDTRPYYETQLLLLDDDTLLAIHRTAASSPGTHYISTSTDFGFTWSAPASAFAGYGAGNAIQMSTGTLVTVTRQNATGDVILFTSIDRGTTWDAGTVLVTTTEMEYAQAIELLSGQGELMVIYGDQPSGATTNADIKTILVTEDVTTGLAAHLADTLDAHDASAISVLDTAAVFAAVNVETALKELYDGIVGGGTVTVKDEGTPLATVATSLDFVGSGVVASGTGAAKTITIAGGSAPNCYQDILTAPVTIVNANTFYSGPSITPAAGVYLVTFEVDISQAHAAGTNHTAQIIHNSVVQKARNTFVGAGGGNASSLSVTVRMTADGSNAITGQAAANRGSSDSVILDTANVNGTTDKCTSITALLVTSI